MRKRELGNLDFIQKLFLQYLYYIPFTLFALFHN